MIETGFEIYVSSLEVICNAIESGQYEKLQAGQITGDYLLFPKEFSPAEILQLGDAVTSFTNVEGRFGEEEDRREPEGPDGCLFVDRLDREWVSAAANLTDDYAAEIQQRWIVAYCELEGLFPQWSSLDRTELIKRFLQLCRLATNSGQDLIHLWFF